MKYEKMWEQLLNEVKERMDKYALTDRYRYQFFRMLHDRMKMIEKEDKTREDYE
ncbi:hypothetical protein [Staphylococcus delphini]|uniref:hypothetical protein n=1 Tax=Staphylococcus delphini TaxID=53344 RepID=UPI000F6CA4D2|nr:hypothetical protein [Staphylococcus delphini]VED62510.1 Uncharacterised protein [Staphylococcus delphini]